MKEDSFLFLFLKRILYIWVCIPLVISRFIPKRIRNKINETYLGQVCKAIERRGDYYTEFRYIQKTSTQYNIPPAFEYDLSDVAIVLQGPIDEEDGFTLETVKTYNKLYSNAQIIVSTWNSQPADAVNSLRKAGAIVVLSEEPGCSGMGNVNYQIVSSRAGIEKAAELGVRFVCKTRTDQRITRTGSLAALRCMVQSLPLKKELENQVFRIACLGYMGSGGMTAPFRISDFLYFGAVEDVKKMFSLDLDTQKRNHHERIRTTKEWLEEKGDPEILLFTSYVERVTGRMDLSIDEYLCFIRDNMLITDVQQLGLYWHKYDDRYRAHKREGACDILDGGEHYLCFNLDSLQWWSLYGGATTVQGSLNQFENASYPVVSSVRSFANSD